MSDQQGFDEQGLDEQGLDEQDHAGRKRNAGREMQIGPRTRSPIHFMAF
jgi:hypothetical protein